MSHGRETFCIKNYIIKSIVNYIILFVFVFLCFDPAKRESVLMFLCFKIPADEFWAGYWFFAFWLEVVDK